jgi:hypothetical protein
MPSLGRAPFGGKNTPLGTRHPLCLAPPSSACHCPARPQPAVQKGEEHLALPLPPRAAAALTMPNRSSTLASSHRVVRPPL